jgi:hypothetical protein
VLAAIMAGAAATHALHGEWARVAVPLALLAALALLRRRPHPVVPPSSPEPGRRAAGPRRSA